MEREAIVGSRTTLDVLNAQQALLNSQVTLVQNLAQLITASYGVASALGRLTARDLHLPVPLYYDTAYYNAVKDKWGGTGRLRHRPTGTLKDHERIADTAWIGPRFSLRSGAAPGGDPSMEDILASIRRILSEDETPAAGSTPPPAAEIAGHDRDDGSAVAELSLVSATLSGSR
jgi:hypothetical protein